LKVLMWMSGGFDKRTTSEHLLVAIIQALYEDGHTVHIIQKDTGGSLPHLPDSLSKLGVTMDCVPCGSASKGNFIGRYLVELQYVFNCRKYLKAHSDSVAVFNQSSTVAGFMSFFVKSIIPKARLTYNVQDVFPENGFYIGKIRGVIYKILSAEQRYAYRHADQIITISEDMKRLLVEKGAKSEKVEVIYNWSYQDETYKQDAVYSDKIASILRKDKLNVVYAGNIGTMQNVEIITNAAKLMLDETDIHFHIFGDGLYKEKIQKEANGMENVSFWPMQPSELAPSIYSMADINIIPLAPNIYRTALPSKTATCIACQKPIVFCIGTSSVFGRQISKQEGFIVTEAADAIGLKNAILRIKKEHPKVDASDVFSEMFSKTKNSKKYSQLITKIRES
jgi:hypothetical protein